jgi:hypothetical protein
LIAFSSFSKFFVGPRRSSRHEPTQGPFSLESSIVNFLLALSLTLFNLQGTHVSSRCANLLQIKLRFLCRPLSFLPPLALTGGLYVYHTRFPW